MDRSKFAVKNYEMIMQVDEDSRRRKHEMKHHMETLYALIDAGKIVQAKNYTEKMIKDTELSSDVNYSTNIEFHSRNPAESGEKEGRCGAAPYSCTRPVVSKRG